MKKVKELQNQRDRVYNKILSLQNQELKPLGDKIFNRQISFDDAEREIEKITNTINKLSSELDRLNSLIDDEFDRLNMELEIKLYEPYDIYEQSVILN